MNTQRIIMDMNCTFIGCCHLASFKCSCSDNVKLCVNHLSSHKLTKNCNFINIQAKIESMRIALVKNALDRLNHDGIKVAKIMIEKINNTLKKNNEFIEESKKKLLNPSENLESFYEWALKYDIKKRNISEFSSYCIYLLSISGDSEKIDEKKKDDQQELK